MRIVVSRSDPSKFVADLVVSPDDPAAAAQVAALGPLDRDTTEVRHKGAPGDYSLAIQTQIECQFSRVPSSGNGAGPCVEAEATQARTEPPMSEDEFQDLIVSLARSRGWKVAVHRPVRSVRPDGSVHYLTPVGADGKGWPDITCARRGQLLVRELKTETGKTTPEQEEWLAELGGFGGVWRPSMLPEIEEALR